MRAAALIIVLILALAPDADGAAVITRSVTGCGVVGAAGTTHGIRSTAGQPVTGPVQALTHALTSGFWSGGGLPTGIPGDRPDTPPYVLRLYQNAPNPFSQLTSIAIDIPEAAGSFTLQIFDVVGRHVRSLATGPQSPGSRTVAWDGRDARGSHVASGVYFYVLESPARRYTKKMTLVR